MQMNHFKIFILSIVVIFSAILLVIPASASAANLYFDAASDGDWANLDNWWSDSGFSVQALALPTVSDDVYIYESITSNSGDSASVNTLSIYSTANIDIDTTVANGAEFNDSSFNVGELTGDTIFNDDSINSGTVTGDVTFNNFGGNEGTIIGDAIFNDYTYSASGITGDVVFNDATANSGGTITGNVIFNDDSDSDGEILGDAVFNDNSENSGGTITGNACFAVTATNSGTVTGTVSVCSAPIVTSSAASSLSTTAATLDANLTDLGGSSATQHGFAYGTDSLLSTVIATTTLGTKSATGTFSSSVTSLTCGTTYYFRPYVTNSTATGFGSITSFTTSACASSGGGGGGGGSSSAGYSSGGNVNIIYNNTPLPTCGAGDIFNIVTGARCISDSVITPYIPPAPVTPQFNFTRNLTLGSQGEDVRQLQIFLNQQGFVVAYMGNGSPGNESMYFGTLTKNALAKYQNANNIYPSEGYFGPITRNKMFK